MAKKNSIDSSYFLSEFYCKLSIKSVEVLPQNIIVVNIRESVFDLIPIMDLTFIDDGMFTERYPFEDGDTISIELARSDSSDVPISMDFILQDFTVDNRDGDNMHLTNVSLTAIMKNTGLFHPNNTRAFSNKTSVDVIKAIGSECGFDPVVKISTSDSMIWRQVNQNNNSMIKAVMKRAFKSEDAVMVGMTRNKQIIITSLNTIVKDKSVKKILYDPNHAISNDIKDGEKKEIIYFNNFNSKNISGMVNKTMGYGLNYSFFDFETVTNKNIVSDSHPLTEFSFKNKNDVSKIVNSGRTNLIDTLNVHRNYFIALAQNEFYTKDFFKHCLTIYINPTNSLNIFDKVDITFPSFDDKDSVNQSMSGQYIVGSILHQASKAGHYRMVVTLFRNGINGSPYMKKSEFKVS